MPTPSAPTNHDADRAAIRQRLVELSDAWNAGDAEAYGAVFTEEASYITWMGQLSRGRSEIVSMHRWLFGKIRGSRMTRGAKTNQEITFLSPDVALVTASGGGTSLPGQELTEDRASTVSFVAVHGPDGWRFAHFQNTRITSMPNQEAIQR